MAIAEFAHRHRSRLAVDHPIWLEINQKSIRFNQFAIKSKIRAHSAHGHEASVLQALDLRKHSHIHDVARAAASAPTDHNARTARQSVDLG
jgi:hypothetical protein